MVAFHSVDLKSQILNTVPVAGSKEELHFGDFTHESVWILFENDHQSWYGCFASGNVPELCIASDLAESTLVIAKGRLYLVNHLEKALVTHFPPALGIKLLDVSEKCQCFLIAIEHEVQCWDVIMLKIGGQQTMLQSGIVCKGIDVVEQAEPKTTISGHLRCVANSELDLAFEIHVPSKQFRLLEKVKEKKFFGDLFRSYKKKAH